MTVFSLCKETAADALKLIESALTEDTGSCDLSKGIDCTTDAVVPHDAVASAAFVSRASGTVCGVEVSRIVAEKFAPRVELSDAIADGQRVKPGQKIATLSGPAHDILTIERTCLNFMCRLSGISTLAQTFVDLIEGTEAQVLDTRKTTPGWRRLEKYAVACGGGTNHRMGLYDAVMLKDNHLAFYRSQVDDEVNVIPNALERARKWIIDNASKLPNGEQTILQLEVDTIEQFQIAIADANPTRPDIVLLDNMSTEQLTSAVEIRDECAPSVLLEASGGVNLDTIAGIAQTGVDRISVGALTHSAMNFDIGLDWISRG
jgi:nicotinate-nucleotide pyrophosphorylase (carboxylating)